MDSELRSKFIIFKSLMTTFEVNIILEAAGTVSIIDLSLNPHHHPSNP